MFLSHLHADHCLDLAGYYVLRKYHPHGAQPRIPVWGPVGTADRMARAYDLPLDPGMHEEFEFRSYAADPVEFGPFSVEAVPVEHPVPAYGLRVTADGATIGYSGDTGPCDGLHAVAADADLFLAEASFITGHDNPDQIHLTGADCGVAASVAGAKRLVLTHIPPCYDDLTAEAEARANYDGPIQLARPGATWELRG